MNFKKIVLIVLMGASLILLSGCKEAAIGKIVGYIQYDVDIPDLARYQEAELEGVTEDNLECINEELSYLNYTDISGGNVLVVGENIQTQIDLILAENLCTTLRTEWTQAAKILASDAEASDYFGYSVAISGDTAIVGAIYEDEGGSSAGAAYIF